MGKRVKYYLSLLLAVCCIATTVACGKDAGEGNSPVVEQNSPVMEQNSTENSGTENSVDSSAGSNGESTVGSSPENSSEQNPGGNTTGQDAEQHPAADGTTDDLPAKEVKPLSSLKFEDFIGEDGQVDVEKYLEWFGVDAETLGAIDESEGEVPEHVIHVAVTKKDYLDIYKEITAFNKAQEQYKAKAKIYESWETMFLDVLSGNGGDLMLLNPTYVQTLGKNDALEDLSSYFEKSEEVQKEDLFSAVVEAGTVEDKMVGLLTGFGTRALLVEKGYTEEGGWTIDQYLALMDKYPDIPVSTWSNPANWNIWLMDDLSKLSDMFVNWEERTCRFDSDEFIALIDKLKNYTDAHNKEESEDKIYGFRPAAVTMSNKEVLTYAIYMQNEKWATNYKNIRDTFFENYELAGVPNLSGEPEYHISTYGNIYGVNAASAKKDGAWAILEFLLSEENQRQQGETNQNFLARRDVMEMLLQEEVEGDPYDTSYSSYNSYTHEHEPLRRAFTEKDKEQLLHILDHVSGKEVPDDRDISSIFYEELRSFWKGDRTAKETAEELQNRVSLFLTE